MVCTIKYRVFLQIFHQAQGKPSEASKAWSPRENRPVVSGNWDPMGGPGVTSPFQDLDEGMENLGYVIEVIEVIRKLDMLDIENHWASC